MIKLVLHSTHGDVYYVGLNGIQLLDQRGFPIALCTDQLQSSPFRFAVHMTMLYVHAVSMLYVHAMWCLWVQGICFDFY